MMYKGPKGYLIMRPPSGKHLLPKCINYFIDSLYVAKSGLLNERDGPNSLLMSLKLDYLYNKMVFGPRYFLFHAAFQREVLSLVFH